MIPLVLSSILHDCGVFIGELDEKPNEIIRLKVYFNCLSGSQEIGLYKIYVD